MKNLGESYYRKMVLNLEKPIIFRNVINEEILQHLKKICSLMAAYDQENTDTIRNLYYNICNKLIIKAEHHSFSGNLLAKYIMYLIFYDENIFSLYCEKYDNNIKASLHDVVLNDIKFLIGIMDFDISEVAQICQSDIDIQNYNCINKRIRKYEEPFLKADTLDKKVELMEQHYNKFGCGQLAEYNMFRWDNEKGLQGIANHDDIKLDDIIGYEYQKNMLINNTKAFLNGYPANNVLLIGARGTGKSSSVKALANEYFNQGLRLLEISKEQIIDFPQILKYICQRGRKFIIFLDDLSFDDFEVEYKYMKSLLEGSTEKKPDNVLFYATSNRRHIVQERWADRQGNPNDDIHTADSLNEKISLSDRFGLTISFEAPNQNQYLEIVEAIAKKEKIEYSKEQLDKEAIAWELYQKGRSGRTARQFINSYYIEHNN